MLAALGVEVLRLVRVAIGPLQLGKLAKGAYRALSSKKSRRWIAMSSMDSPQTQARNSEIRRSRILGFGI